VKEKPNDPLREGMKKKIECYEKEKECPAWSTNHNERKERKEMWKRFSWGNFIYEDM
jgi:hypothetical protein